MKLRCGTDGVLVVIDAQEVFRDESSPWGSPGFDEMQSSVLDLADSFANRIVFTRFVPPALVEGSWQAYYDRWPFALDGEEAWWRLCKPWSGRDSIDVPTFSKWGTRLARLAREGYELVLTGAATDCCVVATALAAVDGGAHVAVVSDACTGSTPAAHQAALDLIARRAPQARVISTRDLNA